ncbi:acyl-CoA thioesterase [Motilimonas sp. KMU-193]|uniref:acyl-CoA thioesterase n=1 Tax=Motilimonas sp. KMU-193 TaxID=3388668 RepID=UPI00396B27E3
MKRTLPEHIQLSQIYHYPVQIYYEDTDFSGVVYHPNFLKYFERAREHVIGAQMLAQLWQQQGIGFAVYKTNMGCFEGVEFADVIDVRTQFYFDGPYRSIWLQEIWRPNGTKPAVTAEIEMVCMNQARALCPLPSEVLQLLESK